MSQTQGPQGAGPTQGPQGTGATQGPQGAETVPPGAVSPGAGLGISETGLIWICYTLHALSFVCGGITSIIAVIINYIKLFDARKGLAGPLTLSHMAWQISTFWLSLFFILLLSLLSIVLLFSVVGLFFCYPLWIGLAIWYVYRLLRGMLALNNGLNVPV